MKSSPVYAIINNSKRKSDCSFGSDGFDMDVRVGTSSSNSHTLADISVQRHIDCDGYPMFTLWVDGVLVKKGRLVGKDFEMVSDHIANI